MKTVIILSIIIAISLAQDIDEETTDVDVAPRVLGGDSVGDRSRYPYQVSLRHNGKHFCAGAIIDSRNVITAAHCMDSYVYDKSDLEVVAGDLRIDEKSGGRQTSDVDYIFVHENYNAATFENDLAVLRLDDELDFNEYVKPIEVDLNTFYPITKKCVLTGWGTTANGNLSPDLKSVDLPIVERGTCNIPYQDNIKQGMLCAGYLIIGEKDSCSGDSGSPLACDGKLKGVVSWGLSCGQSRYPGVYSNATYYYDWINQQTTRSASGSLVINQSLIILMVTSILYKLYN